LSEELEKKETTIRREGLTIRIRRTEKGNYVWVIEADSPRLDPETLEKVIEYADRTLRRKFLGEEVEVPEPPKIDRREDSVEKAEKIVKTIPLESRSGKLFGRIVLYDGRIAVEPVKLPSIRNGAVSWLLNWLEGRYGRDRITTELNASGKLLKRVTIAAKLSDEELEDLRNRARWAFIKALASQMKNRGYSKERWRK